jgi:hypothetical protein
MDLVGFLHQSERNMSVYVSHTLRSLSSAHDVAGLLSQNRELKQALAQVCLVVGSVADIAVVVATTFAHSC